MRPEESIDVLDENLRILQKKKGFKFGLDAILLGDFAKLFPSDTVCDLCTGGGILPLLLWRKHPKSIVGVELQEAYADMATRSVAMNGLAESISILQGDLRALDPLLPKHSFSVVTANPPYKEVGGGLPSEATDKNLAKNEVTATLDDVGRAVAYLLQPHGRLFMVHRTERLCDIFCTLRSHGLEVKRMRLVQGDRDKPPSLVLLEAQKGAKPKMLSEPTLLVMENGQETAEIQRIYGRNT